MFIDCLLEYNVPTHLMIPILWSGTIINMLIMNGEGKNTRGVATLWLSHHSLLVGNTQVNSHWLIMIIILPIGEHSLGEHRGKDRLEKKIMERASINTKTCELSTWNRKLVFQRIKKSKGLCLSCWILFTSHSPRSFFVKC